MTIMRHGVVVIHGQGEGQVRGALLAEFANPVVDLLRAAGNDVTLTFDGDATVPAGRMTVRRPPGREADDADHHVFELREGYWSDAFPPPPADRVTRWALGGLGSQIDGIRLGWWRNPTAAPSEEAHASDAGPAMKRVARRVSPQGPRLLRWFYRLTLIVLSALLMLLSVLTFLILRPLAWFIYALAGTPGVRMFGMTTRVAEAVAGLNPFLSRTLGDTERFVTDGAWAINVRGRIERILLEFLDADFDDITIIAYSAGAGVAYDVLLEGRVVPRRMHELAATGKQPAPIRFVTVGSGIYHMWSFARMEAIESGERRRLYAGRIDPAISGVEQDPRTFPFWTDLFARFDFVAAGPIRDEIASLSDLHEGDHYCSHRVINYDHITDDHGGYFRNKDLAVPRLIAALFGSERWMQEGPSDEATAGAFTYITPRRRAISVFWLNTAKLLPILVLALHALLISLWGGYRELCVRLSDSIVPGWTEGLWAGIAEEVGLRPQYIVIGAVLFAFFVVLGRAFYWLWQPKVDDGEPLSLRRGMIATAGIPTAVWRSIGQNTPAYGMLMLVLLALVAAGAWYYVPGQVRDGAFVLESGPYRPSVEIVDATAAEVALKGAGKHVAHPGLLGLEWDHGYGQIGEVLREYEDRVVRRFTPLVLRDGDADAGEPSLGGARVDSFAFTGDPLAAHGIPFTDVEYAAPLGPQRAWVAGEGDTWAIVVHGRGATRAESLRIFPTLIDLGMTVMAITYRNDRESIQDPNGQYEYGASEWQDLESAVGYALAHGATDVVLYGYSMGGAITASFLQRSERADVVRAAVLDAPMLDFAPTVDLGISTAPVVGAFREVLRAITGVRLGIDWEALNYLDEDVERLRAPILLFHGDADDVVPVETSRTLAELRPDIVTYHEFAAAGHTREWNVDRERYETLVREFLAAQLAR